MKRIKSSFFHRFYNCYSEKKFIEYHISYCLGYNVNLDNPKTFNEKLNWLKLNDRNPLYTKMADKYAVKEYVKEKIGEEYVVPCLGIWNRYGDINFDKLPNKFVLKPTHQSGVIVCKDKSTFNYKTAKEKLSNDLNRNYYDVHKEWVYKNIPPRIIADKFLDDHTGNELRDYKIWCFNGEPKVIYLTNKGENVYENFYDMNFNPLNINHGFLRYSPEFEKPEELEKMKELAGILSENIPFVRIDFFVVDGAIYFGECTFYDWGGAHPFESYEQDLSIGNWLNLLVNGTMHE